MSFQVPNRKADIFGELMWKPGQSLKPGNGLLRLITVRDAVRTPPGNDLSPSVFGLPAAILDPDATGFLVQQGLEQLASVLQIVLPFHFPLCGNRDLDRVRFLAVQSQMIKNELHDIAQDLGQLRQDLTILFLCLVPGFDGV
ncbi:hypothetical protein AD939_02065, partial [Gluconobacter oxydans]|uniref:hypothetical protein n=1 Tax=Gluconobacter oxydans TaxID=442 RepID=UPI000793D60C